MTSTAFSPRTVLRFFSPSKSLIYGRKCTSYRLARPLPITHLSYSHVKPQTFLISASLPGSPLHQRRAFLQTLPASQGKESFERVKMADMRAVATEDAFSPAGPYSQAVITPTLIFVSGQVPRPPANSTSSTTSASTSASSKPAIASDTALCIANIRAILEAAGSSIDKVVKTTVFLTDMERDFSDMNSEYAQHFTGGPGGIRPARSCVEVKRLPLGVQVEIECVALP